VLEIGFGSGEVLFSFHPNCEIFGVELSGSAVEEVNKKAASMNYRVFNVQVSSSSTLDYPDSYFDIVVASHVIEHIENDDLIMKEVHRVLKNGGCLIVLIPINEKYFDPNHVHKYTAEKFLKVGVEYGYKLIYYLENEQLFHLVEKFYYEGYKEKWKAIGSLVAVVFNISFSIWPFSIYQELEKLFLSFGFKPRQFGCVLEKVELNAITEKIK
jgi:ubiquinone/menaquinone biosynthesis C-methylase UbiE